MGSTSDEFYRFQSVQTTGGCCSCEETPSVVASDQPCLILEPPPEAFPLVGLLGYRFQSCFCEAVKKPPFSGSSDQPCFDTGTSTRGLSTGGTVGGTGSSLVQTTGVVAQRVHLPEVAVTIETLISPVQNFGPVPVLFRLPVGSLASQ